MLALRRGWRALAVSTPPPPRVPDGPRGLAAVPRGGAVRQFVGSHARFWRRGSVGCVSRHGVASFVPGAGGCAAALWGFCGLARAAQRRATGSRHSRSNSWSAFSVPEAAQRLHHREGLGAHAMDRDPGGQLPKRSSRLRPLPAPRDAARAPASGGYEVAPEMGGLIGGHWPRRAGRPDDPVRDGPPPRVVVIPAPRRRVA